MSRARSLSLGRIYGLSRVTRVWGLSRATVYRSRVETPEDAPRRRPGPIGACSDAELADHIVSGATGTRRSVVDGVTCTVDLG
jgi:putative transposase